MIDYIVPILHVVFSSDLNSFFFLPCLAASALVAIFSIIRRLCR